MTWHVRAIAITAILIVFDVRSIKPIMMVFLKKDNPISHSIWCSPEGMKSRCPKLNNLKGVFKQIKRLVLRVINKLFGGATESASID